MTLFLSESEVAGLIQMDEAVAAVETAFRRESEGEAVNSPRTRTTGGSSTFNVMQASLGYLGRAGTKSYIATRRGTGFVFVLFDMDSPAPLAVMGADALGRCRTGAASAVATKLLHGRSPVSLCVFGSGRQAITQAKALAVSPGLAREVRVWSRDAAHAKSFARLLETGGCAAAAFGSPEEAAAGCNVGCAITSSEKPFLGPCAAGALEHLNLCGSNSLGRSEAEPAAVALFDTVVVDDLVQARSESGDLALAAESGVLDWKDVAELKDFAGGKRKPRGRTLFKSSGVALEDVAVASLVYDRAVETGRYRELDFRG